MLEGGGRGGPWGSPVLPFLQLSQSGLLTSFVPPQLLRLYQLLLFTLPGTPVFSYGDEIGLEEAALPGQVSLAACPAQWGRLHSSVTVVLWLAVDGQETWGGACVGLLVSHLGSCCVALTGYFTSLILGHLCRDTTFFIRVVRTE